MKRFVCVLLVLIFLVSISGCNIEYKGPFSQVLYLDGHGGTFSMNIPVEKQEIILSFLNEGQWEDGGINLGHDYEFITEKETIRYSSEYGTFIDITHKRYMDLYKTKKEYVNNILGI